jgi:hypothetical protein
MDYSSKQEKALEMISKYGAALSVVVLTKSSYNATSDAWTASTATYSTLGLITEFAERDINGTTIQAGDRKVILPAKDLPALDELDDFSIVYGAIVWDPVNVAVLSPGGEPILYTVQVRA